MPPLLEETYVMTSDDIAELTVYVLSVYVYVFVYVFVYVLCISINIYVLTSTVVIGCIKVCWE